MEENTENISHRHSILKILSIFFLLLLFIIIIPIGIFFTSTNKFIHEPSSKQIASSPTPVQIILDFFYSAIPRPLEKLTIDDIPNSRNILGAVEYNGHVFVSGDGSIIEYDFSSTPYNIVRYSNPKKAYCNSNLVIVTNFLYAACQKEGHAFLHNYATSQTIPPDSVYKIDIATGAIDTVFDKSNGLTGQYNYVLVSDGTFVWVGTDNGLGRIDTKTNKVKYYTTALGTEAGEQERKFAIQNIFVDGKYVWVQIGADVYSKGGMSLFDKDTQTLQSFGPEVISGGTDRFDPYIQGIQKVDNGIRIVTESSSGDVCIIKKYDYSTKQWIDEEKQPFQGCLKRLSPLFNNSIYAKTTNENGFTEVVNSAGNILTINGRSNLLLSPIFVDKRYILTSSTIDIVHDGLDEPETLIHLNEDISHQASVDIARANATMLIEQKGIYSIVIDSGCTAEGSCHTGKIWLIDLQAGKILKTYTHTFPNTSAFQAQFWTINSQENTMIVNDKEGKALFSIDTNKYTFLQKPL